MRFSIVMTKFKYIYSVLAYLCFICLFIPKDRSKIVAKWDNLTAELHTPDFPTGSEHFAVIPKGRSKIVVTWDKFDS